MLIFKTRRVIRLWYHWSIIQGLKFENSNPNLTPCGDWYAKTADDTNFRIVMQCLLVDMDYRWYDTAKVKIEKVLEKLYKIFSYITYLPLLHKPFSISLIRREITERERSIGLI